MLHFTKGFPENSLWILLFASIGFLNPDPKKVFYTIPRTCVSLHSSADAALQFGYQTNESIPLPNQLPFELVKDVLGIAEVRF